jgi:hypothetical protein
VLGETRTLDVQEFVVDSVVTSSRVYEGHQEQTVFGRYRPVTVILEAGTTAVFMDQPLARLAFGLLEPRSDDGFVAWGFLADLIAPGASYPVVRAFPEAVTGLSFGSRSPMP